MVRAVLFDLGETLLTYGDQPTVFRLYLKGLEDFYARLKSEGREVPDWPRFRRHITRRFKMRYFWSHFRRHEMDGAAVARSSLADFGLQFDDGAFREACRTVFGHIRSNLIILPAVRETLEMLSERGLATGVISNVVIPSFLLEEDLQKEGLAPFLDARVYSVDAGFRKPSRELFERGLRAVGVSAREAIYVGNRLYADVWGASRCGMRTVLVRTGPAGVWPFSKPDAVIGTLAEFGDLLDGELFK